MTLGRLRLKAVGPTDAPRGRVVFGVIKDARRRQRHRRQAWATAVCAAVAIALIVLLPPGGGRSPSRGPAAHSFETGSSSGSRVIASQGVSVRLPAGWVGTAADLPQGGSGGFAWLQATNFPSGHRMHGEDPLKSMRPGGVAVTITDGPLDLIRRLPHGSPLTVARATPIPQADTPRGHLELALTPMINGRPMVIDIDFGSRATASRLAQSVNGLLRTLKVQAHKERH